MPELKRKKGKQCAMVCVTRQRSCERLIKYGAVFSRIKGCGLIVVHALHSDQNILGDKQESQALEWLFDVARAEDGELLMLRTDDVMQTLCDCAQEHNATAIVLGKSPGGKDDFAKRLKSRLPSVAIIVVEE